MVVETKRPMDSKLSCKTIKLLVFSYSFLGFYGASWLAMLAQLFTIPWQWHSVGLILAGQMKLPSGGQWVLFDAASI